MKRSRKNQAIRFGGLLFYEKTAKIQRKVVFKTMRKVLYCASNPTHLRNFHIPYIQRLLSRGDEVWTLCSGDFAAEGTFRRLNLSMRKNVLSPTNLLAAVRLAGLLRRESFDLICLHTSLAAFVVRLAVLLAGKGKTRVVNTVHGYLFDDRTFFLKRQLLLLPELLLRRMTDRVVVMNEWDRVLAEKHRLGREIVWIPGVGVDFSRFSGGEREKLRAALGINPEDILLLYPAEFSGRKNQRFLIRAMTKLPERVFLALPGEGSLLEDCRRACDSLGLQRRVLFPGQLRDLSDWYAAADICVSASRYEGLPFNIMEGMHAARPVVASRIKGHRDLVKEGAGGFLFTWGDEEEYLDCVRTLLEDGELRRIMGEKNRRSAEAYALERVEAPVFAAMTGEAVPAAEKAEETVPASG